MVRCGRSTSTALTRGGRREGELKLRPDVRFRRCGLIFGVSCLLLFHLYLRSLVARCTLWVWFCACVPPVRSFVRLGAPNPSPSPLHLYLYLSVSHLLCLISSTAMPPLALPRHASPDLLCFAIYVHILPTCLIFLPPFPTSLKMLMISTPTPTPYPICLSLLSTLRAFDALDSHWKRKSIMAFIDCTPRLPPSTFRFPLRVRYNHSTCLLPYD